MEDQRPQLSLTQLAEMVRGFYDKKLSRHNLEKELLTFAGWDAGKVKETLDAIEIERSGRGE